MTVDLAQKILAALNTKLCATEMRRRILIVNGGDPKLPVHCPCGCTEKP